MWVPLYGKQAQAHLSVDPFSLLPVCKLSCGHNISRVKYQPQEDSLPSTGHPQLPATTTLPSHTWYNGYMSWPLCSQHQAALPTLPVILKFYFHPKSPPWGWLLVSGTVFFIFSTNTQSNCLKHWINTYIERKVLFEFRRWVRKQITKLFLFEAWK